MRRGVTVEKDIAHAIDIMRSNYERIIKKKGE